MAFRTCLHLSIATNKCFITTASHCKIKFSPPNVYKTIRGFKRLTEITKSTSTRFLGVKVESSPVKLSKLWKPLGFAIVFSGTTLVGAAIWEYERVREQTYRIINRYRYYRINKTGWRSDMERWWRSLTDGQRIFVPICFLNVLVFLAWKVPKFHTTMVRYFCANPASSITCWPMVLATFSHYSFLHLAANMYVLHSFSSTIVSLLEREQFLALYLSSGVISNFASHLYKTAFGLPGLSLGASGAIMGILGFVCTQQPDTLLTIIFLPMYTFTAGMVIKVLMGMDVMGCVLGWKYFDHAAHLGGALFGIFWHAWGNANIWQKREPVLTLWHELRNIRRSD